MIFLAFTFLVLYIGFMEEMKSLKYWTIYDATALIKPRIERWMRSRGISKYNRANLELLDFALRYYTEPEEDVYIRAIVRDELQKARTQGVEL